MNQIVITGSTRGIGRALAERFLEQKWSVVINGRSQDIVDRVVGELSADVPGCSCRGLAGDVSRLSDMERLGDFAAAGGGVDIWINNAGIDQSRDYLWNLDPEEIRAVLEVNVLGSLTGTRAALGVMSNGGTVYLMEGFGSNGMVRPGVSIYGASKAALSYLYKALKSEFRSAGLNVGIGVISPGMVLTDLLLSGLPADPTDAKSAKRVFNILADTPERVSSYISGRIIRSRPKRIKWLSGFKIVWRFATSFMTKRNFFADEN